MSHKEQTTHRTTATRNVPSLQDTGTKGVVRKGHAPVSIPRALVARAGPNVKAGDKTKLKERKTPSAGTRRTDGRLADSRRRSLWDAVRERGTAFMAQTVNFDTLTELPFESTMLDLEGALQGLSIRDAAYHAWVAVRRTLADQSLQRQDVDALATAALDNYLVELGAAIMDKVSGSHFTFLLPGVGSRREIVSHAQRLIGLFQKKGIYHARVVVSIPASEEGISAAQILTNTYGIKTNLYLASGFHHALVCAEAGASAVTFSWKALTSANTPPAHAAGGSRSRQAYEQQWVGEIQAVAEYFKEHKPGVQSMLIDLCGNPAAGLLQAVDRISIRDSDLKPLDANQCTVPPADLVPHSQARQIKCPNPPPTQQSGFMSGFDDQARAIAGKVLYHGVQDVRRARKRLLQAMKDEIRRQSTLQCLDAVGLASMYHDDLLAEQTKPKAHKRVRKEDPTPMPCSKRKANPRLTHIGYRLAQMYWGQSPERPRHPSPPLNFDSEGFEAEVAEYLATVSQSAPEDPLDEFPAQDLLEHLANFKAPKKSTRPSETRELNATKSDPGPATDGRSGQQCREGTDNVF